MQSTYSIYILLLAFRGEDLQLSFELSIGQICQVLAEIQPFKVRGNAAVSNITESRGPAPGIDGGIGADPGARVLVEVHDADGAADAA